MPIPTINEQRAERAGFALIAYRAAAVPGPKLDDPHTIAMLMVDLCHLARRHGADPGPILTLVRARYRQHEQQDGQASPFPATTL